MAKIRKVKGCKGWFLDYRDLTGRRIIRKAGEDRDEAQYALGQIVAREAERRRARRLGHDIRWLPRDVALAEVAERYLAHVQAVHAEKPRTVASYRRVLGAVLGYLTERGIASVGQVTPAAVAEYRETRMTEPRTVAYRHYGRGRARVIGPVGERTANAYAGALRAMLNWAAGDGGLIAANPLAGLRPLRAQRARRVRRALSHEEKRRLLQASPEPFRTMWYAFLATGLRRGELASLTWKDVDLERGEIAVRGEASKNGELATVPLRRDLWAMLAAMRGRRRSDHVFVNARGRPWRYNLHKHFNACLEAAGIEKRNSFGVIDIHCLRVTYATDLVEAGADIRTVQRLMRHRSPVVTMRFYAKVREGNLRAAVEAVPLGAAEGGGGLENGNKVETFGRGAWQEIPESVAS